jgi:hypothetical protein
MDRSLFSGAYKTGGFVRSRQGGLHGGPENKFDPSLAQETHMNTLSSKLTAFAAALAMNGFVLGGLGYLFALQSHPNISALAFAKAVVQHQWLS